MTAGRRWLAALAFCVSCTGAALAQEGNTDSGPVSTVAGTLTFVREGATHIAQLDGHPFDRQDAARLTHFDDPSQKRVLVAASDGALTLYDFRSKPPAVEHIGRRMTLQGVFWQGDEVVLKGSDGWYRYEHGK